jgi:hypothetical protein
VIIGSAIAASFTSGSGVINQLTEWAMVAYFASTILAVILVVVVIYNLLFRRDQDED